MGIVDRIVDKCRRDGFGGLLVGIIKFPLSLRRRYNYTKMLKLNSPKQRFSEIYKSNLWASDESGSGGGSEANYTQTLRNWLVAAIRKHDVRTIVDAPCGDFNWMKLVLPEVDVEYCGFDIVDSVIERNKATFGSDSIHFAVADICSDELQPCDFLFVRDCLFHLSFEDVDRFLKNIAGLDYKFLLTNTHLPGEGFENSDILTGDFRLIDLYRAPFNFDRGSALECVDDHPPGFSIPREMILIEKKNVPLSLRY